MALFCIERQIDGKNCVSNLAKLLVCVSAAVYLCSDSIAIRLVINLVHLNHEIGPSEGPRLVGFREAQSHDIEWNVCIRHIVQAQTARDAQIGLFHSVAAVVAAKDVHQISVQIRSFSLSVLFSEFHGQHSNCIILLSINNTLLGI